MAAQPGTIQDIRAQLLALSPAEFQALKATYHYRWVTSLLRTNGWTNLFLGGLTLWLGLSGLGQSIFKVVQTILGLIIVGQSLWALRESSVSNIQRFSILFALCGVWNIFLGLLASLSGAGFLVALLGALQLWGAYRFRKIHQQYAQMALVKPSPETAMLYDTIWKSLNKNIIHTDDDYIELQLQQRPWRGFLLPDQIILAYKQRNVMIIADKTEVSLVPKNPGGAGRWVSVTSKFDIIAAMAGKMPRPAYERYVRWKESTGL